MLNEHSFARDEVLPSWWANALGKYLSLGAFNFQLTRQDATHLAVVAGANEDAAIISVGGLWRFVEATVSRAHPGGAPGTYDVYVTAAANVITSSPAAYSDHTNYAFALAIVTSGATPAISAGVVDVFRKVGSLQWNGSQITRIDQSIPMPARHAHTHAAGGPDPLSPADIGAAAAIATTSSLAALSDELLAEANTRAAADTAEANARVAADTAEASARAAADSAEAAARAAADVSAGQKAAAAGTSGTPSNTNRYVTNSDARLIVVGEWTPLILTANNEPLSGAYVPAARLFGDIVQLRGGVNYLGSGEVTFGSVPSFARPAQTLDLPGPTGSGLNRFQVNTDGTLVLEETLFSSEFWLDGLSYSLA